MMIFGRIFSFILAILSIVFVNLKVSWGTKITIIIFAIVVILNTLKREIEYKKKEKKRKRYSLQKEEEIYLIQSGYTQQYIHRLGRNPVLKNDFSKGIHCLKNYDYENAIIYFEKCEAHPEATNENIVALRIYIGICYHHLNNSKNALKYYSKALKYSNKLKVQKIKFETKAIIKANSALTFLFAGEVEKAQDFSKDGLSFSKKVENDALRANVLSTIATIKRNIGRKKEAQELLIEVIEINNEIGNEENNVSSYQNLGVIHRSLKEFSKSKDCYEKAIKISDENDDKIGLCISHIGLGITIFERSDEKDIDGSLDHLNIALKIARDIRMKSLEAAALGNIGNCYLEKKDLRNANTIYLESLEISYALSHELGIASNLSNLGSIKFTEKKYNEAIKNYQEAIEIFKKIGRRFEEAQCHFNIGGASLHLRNYSEAEKRIKMALRMFTKLGLESKVKETEIILKELQKIIKESKIKKGRPNSDQNKKKGILDS